MGYAIAQHMVAPEKRQAKLLASTLVERDNSRVIASLLEAIYANAVASGDYVFEMLELRGNVRQIFMTRNPYRRKVPCSPFIR